MHRFAKAVSFWLIGTQRHWQDSFSGRTERCGYPSRGQGRLHRRSGLTDISIECASSIPAGSRSLRRWSICCLPSCTFVPDIGLQT